MSQNRCNVAHGVHVRGSATTLAMLERRDAPDSTELWDRPRLTQEVRMWGAKNYSN
jgi:hypothetical protein